MSASAKKKVEEKEHAVTQGEVNRMYGSWVMYLLLGVIAAFLVPASIQYDQLGGASAEFPGRVFTPEELARFDGKTVPNVRYLAILGKVYDVSTGGSYINGAYSFFVGKDASRAFTSGKFEGKADDDLSDLTDSQVKAVLDWADFYATHDTYEYMGLVQGRYYDKDGKPTEEVKKLETILAREAEKAAAEKELELKYPTCNSRWSQKEGSRVWCTKDMSEKNVVLVPRRMFKPGSRQLDRCACVEYDALDTLPKWFKPMEGCDPQASTCSFFTEADLKAKEEAEGLAKKRLERNQRRSREKQNNNNK